ncbi:hypothetical protein [Mucilaginibacter terrenus]|nr:hypothetical protein [Mucilaginibacter terrenus]
MLWNIAFSITCLFLVSVYGVKVAGFVLFFKLLGYAATIFLQSYTAKNVYMYYRNAGISVRRMYFYVFSLDLLTYLFALAILITLTA